MYYKDVYKTKKINACITHVLHLGGIFMKIDSIGIDKGSTYTKDSNGNMFKSVVALADGEFGINKSDIFALDSNYFIVGDKALKKNYDYATDLLKTEQYNTKVCVYYALSKFKVDQTLEYGLVNLGLPIGKYFHYKNNYKNMFILERPVPIMLGRTIKNIIINRVEVIPESAGIFYSQDISEFAGKKVIVIDIGGLSVDISVYDDCEITNVYDTFDMGMMHTYQMIVGKINNLYDTNYTAWDIEGMLNSGLYIMGKNYTDEFNYITNGIFEIHTKEIVNKLKLLTNINDAYTVLLGGGGGKVLERYFVKYIPHIRLIDDYQFANAKMFNEIGKVMYL